MNTRLFLPLVPFLLLGAGACRTVQYDDPDKVETLTIDFGSTDLKTLASGMVDSMIAAPQLAYIDHGGKGDDKRIIIYTAGVNNRTSEHIDTTGITDSIRTSLLKSGRFRLAATDQGQDDLGEQVRFQQGSGRVDPTQAKAFGKQIGADMVLLGNLRSIEKSHGRSDDVWYQFVLELVDIETGEIIWIEEQDIRKTEKSGIFGT
jgi:uncharacterized protein (TIGR02722 family)